MSYQTLYDITNRLLHNITQPNVNPVFLNNVIQNIEQWNNSLEHTSLLEHTSSLPEHTSNDYNIQRNNTSYYRHNYLQNIPVVLNTESQIPNTNSNTMYSYVNSYGSLPSTTPVNVNNDTSPLSHHHHSHLPRHSQQQHYYRNTHYTTTDQHTTDQHTHTHTHTHTPHHTPHHIPLTPHTRQLLPPTTTRNNQLSPQLSHSHSSQSLSMDSVSNLVSTMFEQFMNHSNMDNFIIDEFEDANGTRVTIQQFGIGGDLPDIQSGNEVNTLQNLLNQLLQSSSLNDVVGEDQPVPLARNILNTIPIKKYTNQTPLADPCAVCQNHYKNDDLYRTLFCQHNFHTQCIDKWFEDHVTCPMCRSDMREY
jgi:hypothetical protein